MRHGRVNWLCKPNIIFILRLLPLLTLAQEIEQKPNNPCTFAQMLGAAVLPTYIDGSLVYLDVDFFKYYLEPDTYRRHSHRPRAGGRVISISG